MKMFAGGLLLLCSALCVSAQETTGNLNEKRVPLSEAAVAMDATGAPALEATLRTTALNGAPETPVTNVRMLFKNRSNVAYAFVSGSVTFYDAAGGRCGEGQFKADSLAPNESFETDSPGLRIRCEAASWRIAASNLLIRTPPNAPIGALGDVRIRRFEAAMRQLAASQRMRSPGLSVSNDSFGASESALNCPSPQRPPAAS